MKGSLGSLQTGTRRVGDEKWWSHYIHGEFLELPTPINLDVKRQFHQEHSYSVGPL